MTAAGENRTHILPSCWRSEEVEAGFKGEDRNGIARPPCALQFIGRQDKQIDGAGKRGHRPEDVGNAMSRIGVLAPVQHDEDVRIRTRRRAAGPQGPEEKKPKTLTRMGCCSWA